MALSIPPRHVVDPGALTPAEAEFVRTLQSEARDLREAAARLGISLKSAQRRSGVICQKLGAANWREAIALWRGQAA
ncbi:hypothetical protein EDE12_11270 [Methylosinus sp. sav-2]|uniref:hypothetical protein n=1 Tax=Methylosinus sp. sav-2 TaxID=2485168 RepID=UPI00047B28F7|nr:hypothetical protein [Methylosinus sp. sav-2]TDX61968.1 hypothetical protein EDE12_11270 [Methylosinus sp. sav-2]